MRARTSRPGLRAAGRIAEPGRLSADAPRRPRGRGEDRISTQHSLPRGGPRDRARHQHADMQSDLIRPQIESQIDPVVA